jgi:DNA-binding transcriptional ArsR family regulator
MHRIKNPPKRPQSTKAPHKPDRVAEDIFALIGKAENINEAADAMQAMAHPLRLKILCLLGSGELAAGEIVEAVGTTQGNVSQHLSVLRDRGLITSRSEGRQVFYKIEDARVLKMISLTRDIFCSI